MQVGDVVRVLPPFQSTHDGEYIIISFDGDTYFLDGIAGGFCADYLEAL